LRNDLGERFMKRYDPDRMELSTRDRVALAHTPRSRRAAAHLAEASGSTSRTCHGHRSWTAFRGSIRP
jgi:aspartate oxidase